jgi:hypothetical protein
MGEKVTPQFETDLEGNIITKPVVGYTMSPIAGMFVLLAVQYSDSPEALERGENRQIQFALMPQQCLEIAEALTRQAKRLIGPAPSGTLRH